MGRTQVAYVVRRYRQHKDRGCRTASASRDLTCVYLRAPKIIWLAANWILSRMVEVVGAVEMNR
jgi:hypothetical protein